jgi:hypothetical protein
MKKIILSIFLSISILYSVTVEEAEHRLPPIIYSIDIPKVVKSKQNYDFKWSVMGYHDTYDLQIVAYNKNNKKLIKKTVSPYKTDKGEYRWGDIQSKRFFYSSNINLDFDGSQEIVLRFFASPVNDSINTAFLSCLVPGGLGYKAGDTTGRKILIDGIDTQNNLSIDSIEAISDSGVNSAKVGDEIKFVVKTNQTSDNIKVFIYLHDGVKYYTDQLFYNMKEIYSGEFNYTRTEGLKAGNRKFKIIVKDLNNNILAVEERTIEVQNSSSISLAIMNKYINEYTGECIDMDGAYGCQCMDLMHHYVDKVLGIPRSVSPLKSGGPDAIYNNIFKNIDSKSLSYGSTKVRLDKVPNTATSIPQVGDIIIWKATAGNGYFGHVGIFISGDVNSFKSFDQNWSPSSLTVGSPAKIINHNYNNVIGYLRPVLLSQ